MTAISLPLQPLGRQAGQGDQRTGSHRVWNHTGVQERSQALFERMLRVTNLLLLVNEFIDQDGQRQGEGHNAAGAGPAIGAAQQKIHREEPTEKQKHRCDEQSNDVRKSSLPQQSFGCSDL